MSYYAGFIALGEVLQHVGEDVKAFVVDERDERGAEGGGGEGERVARAVPESLIRACALMENKEVTGAVAKVASAVASGITQRGSALTSSAVANAGVGVASTAGDNLMESVVDALVAPHRLKALGDFVGETSRNLMQSCVSVAKDNIEVIQALTGYGTSTSDARGTAAESAAAFLDDAKNKELAFEVGTKLVDAAMTTYVRETAGTNMYDDMFASVRDSSNKKLFLEFMNALVETSVRTYVTATAETYREENVTPVKAPRETDSPTSPLRHTVDAPASTPQVVILRDEVPSLVGSWKDLFRAATMNKENRRLVLSTVATTTRAAFTGFATGMYDVVFRGRIGNRVLAMEYYALAVVFAMASVLIFLCVRILAVFTIASTPT